MQLIILLQSVCQKVKKYILKMLPSLGTWLQQKWSPAAKSPSSSSMKTTPKKSSSLRSTPKRKSKRGKGRQKN